MTVWFITGASRGFGELITRQALQRGDAVVATARDAETLAQRLGVSGDRLLTVELDVTDQQQAQRAADLAVSRFGRIDVLVNNAGRGLVGAVEEASDAEIRAIFETNVFGLLAVSRAVLPVMRAQRSGRVINLSSILGFSAKTGWGIYSATKFAVEGLSESMRTELAPLGIDVTLVEPGLFRTDFLDRSSLRWAATIIKDYDETSGKIRSWAEKFNHEQLGDPAKAAKAIIDVALMDNPPARLPLGTDCVERMGDKLRDVGVELDQWRSVALSMVHDSSDTLSHAGKGRS